MTNTFDFNVANAPGCAFSNEVTRDYNWPQKGDLVQSRSLMTDYHLLCTYARDGVATKTSGQFQKFGCSKCGGFCTVKFERGVNATGTVTESRKCKCKLRDPMLDWEFGTYRSFPVYTKITGKGQKKHEKQDDKTAVTGHVLRHINEKEKVRIVRVMRGQTAEDGKRKNQSTDVALTFLTECGRVFVAHLSKRNSMTENNWKLHDYKEGNAATTTSSTLSLDSTTSQPSVPSPPLEKAEMPKGPTATTTSQSHQLETPNKKAEMLQNRTCSVCNEEAEQLYLMDCPQCREYVSIENQAKYCLSCLRQTCSRRTQKHLTCDNDNNLRWFCLKNQNFKAQCVKCTTVKCSRYLRDVDWPNGDSHFCDLPFGWVGDLPCLHEPDYEKAMRVYSAIVKPYVLAYNNVWGMWQHRIGCLIQYESQSRDWLKFYGPKKFYDIIREVKADIELLSSVKDYLYRRAYYDVNWLRGTSLGTEIDINDCEKAEAIHQKQIPSIDPWQDCFTTTDAKEKFMSLTKEITKELLYAQGSQQHRSPSRENM